MGDKRIVYVEIDERTFVNSDGINSGLEGLAIKAADSCDFEDILNEAIFTLYKAQPEGIENYSSEKPKVGRLYLNRFNNQKAGNMNIEWVPSEAYHKKWGYKQRCIGTIDLRKRTYSVSWDPLYNENYHQIPESVMIDTDSVMKSLGLTKK